MGNHAAVPYLVDEGVKLKSNFSSSIPLPEQVDSMDDLVTSSENKRFLLLNLDSFYLASSLLEEANESLLRRGLRSFQSLSTEEMEQLKQHYANLQNCALSGVKVKLRETLSILEGNCAVSASLCSLPHFSALQAQMAMFHVLSKIYQHERNQHLLVEQPRVWSLSTLNTIANPEVKTLLSWQKLGLNMLKMCQTSYGLTGELGGDSKSFVVDFCTNLASLPDLYHFKSWSPRNRKPSRKIDLKHATVTCSSGDGQAFLAKPKAQFWSTTGGWWSIKIFAQRVSYLLVSWISSRLKKFLVGAPRKVFIFIRTRDNNGIEGNFEEHSIVEPDKVKEKQQTWEQLYPIMRDNVCEIKLVFSYEVSRLNTVGTTKLHQLELFAEDDDVVWVDSLALLEQTQSALLPLGSIPLLRQPSLHAVFGVLRSSASLSLCLNFITYLLNLPEDARCYLDTVAVEFRNLLDSIRKVHCGLIDEYNKTYCVDKETEVHVGFDDDHKYGVCSIDNLHSVTVSDTHSACCYVKQELLGGIFEWSLEVENSQENLLLGLALNSTNLCETVSGQVFTIDSSTGELSPSIWHPKVDLSAFAYPRTFLFRYENCNRMVSLSCNGTDFGVIFELVPSGLSPCFVVKNCKAQCSVKLSSFARVINTGAKQRLSLQQPSNASNLMHNCSTSVQFAYCLLTELGELALSRISFINNSDANKLSDLRLLEYYFCVEVSVSVFERLNSLLKQLLSMHAEDGAILSVLSLLEVQVLSLSRSNASLVVVELSLSQQLKEDMTEGGSLWQTQHDRVLSEAFMTVLSIIKQRRSTLCSTAVQVYCRGIRVFALGSAGRVNAAAKILEELNCCQQSGSHEGIWLNTLIVLMESLGDYAILAELIKNIDVVDTSSLLAVLSHVMNTLLEVETSSTLRESRPDCTDAFVEAAVTFLIVFHEQVSCGLLERGEGGQPDDKLDLLFFSFVQSILSSCSTLINELTAQQLDHGVKLGSPLVKLCFPVLCQLTSSNFPLNLLSKVVSALTPFLDGVCKACMQSLSCRESLNLLAAQMGSDRTSTEVISSEGGWKTLKSTFEDGDSSFNITDNGTTYTSVHSGNTCAIVPMKFGSGQRAAWEFLLETDSMADECSVFGAARMPLSSRCYSSSSDLWMRRSYNGYMYCQGQTTGNNMDKIHPGDVVRIEFDGSLGTLSYSVNGSELEVGFSDIVDEVHPACGSYRSGVSIKLLKVEVYEKKKVATDTDDLLSELKVTNPVWVYSGAASSRDPAVLCQSLPKDKKKVVAHLSWLSAKASSGARCGTHDFALELSDNSESSFCLGVMFGATLPEDLALGADFSQTKVSLHSSSPLSQPTLDYAFGDTIIDYGINHLNKYFLNGMSVYAWHSDGSLWFNGVKVCAAYGLQFLPLRKYTTVVVRIDRSLRFIEFLINGRSAGVAFGPSGVCKIPLPPCTTSVKDFCTNEVMQTVFPCASIYGSSLVLRIRAAGSVGSITVPTLLSLRQTTATTISRLATRLLEGNKQGLDEKSVISWLQSPLFIGGLDQDLVALIAQKEEWLQAFLTSASKDVRLSTLSVEDNLLYQLGSTSSSRELSPSVSALYEYLEKLDPDPVSLKNILERSGSYRFPDCELPFIACLLKQSGLIVEAVKVVETPSDGNHVLASEDLRALWQRVKQLRLFLRQKRQKLKNSVLNSNVADLIVETIEETNSSKLEDIFDISAHDLCLASITQKGFAFIQTVAWHKQENASCAGTQDGSLVTVHSVGLDAENKLAYVVASVKSHKALTSLSESTILIDGFELAAPVVLKVKDDGQYVLLVQKFNTATLPSTTSIHAKSDVVFCLLKGEFGSVKLVLKDAADNRSVGTSSGFEQLCHSVRVRSLLVLLLHSNMRRLDSHTKSILLGLTSKYSGASGLFRNKAELTRWKTQDRWKRVIEFLRVQSKASMHESAPTGLLSRSESLEKSLNPMKPVIQEDFIDEDDVGLLDFAKQSVSNTQTVLQACAVFVLSEDIKCSASSFISIIKTRVNRADYRIASLNALRTVLSHRAVESDPMVVFDILAGLENALPTGSALIGIQTGTESEDSHYLKHLEGCDGKKLREVQQAFSDFYLALSYTLSNYITYWDQGLPACADMEVSMGALDAQDNKLSYPSSVYVQPILQIMRLWTIRFSNRDFGWILSSGMLPNLCKLTSLTFFEKLALKWRNYAEKWFNISSTIDPIVLRSRKVSIWSQDFVLHSLSNHTLSSRALLLHLAMVVSTNFSAEENSALQLTLNDASIFMANLEEATEKYCKVQTIYYSNLERVLEDKRIEDTAREEAEKKISQEKLKQLSGCGTFDPDKKADEVNLEDFNRIASLRGNESGVSVCAYANICFDTRTNLEASGNYFEVKMQELGQGDIGVGFADNDTFPVREQMPGWISHSYGYHGDDGKKYGEHSTSGDFPLFEVGDVIGCGFDKDSRSIFYTRNGVLLGVGFENIEDDKLWPVIGFSNRHDDLAKVSINFGLEPFMYTAESILLNFNVAAELESRNTVSSTPESSCITVNEGGEEESRGESAATLRLLQHALQRSETQLFEHHRLKGVASLLLQFLLAICSQKDHDNDYDLKKHHEVDREIAKVPLVKDFSTFGTPKAVTIADESSLNESIVAALLHEVTVGVSYVVRICSQKQFSILELEDKLLGYEVSSEGRVHKLVLEVHEVQQCIIEHLSALNNLVESSRLIREELSTVKSLKCLFSCFSCSYSVQRLVMSILLTIIPTMDCDIIETAITPEWREKLNHIDSVVHALGSKRKQRRMPDSFIRIMLLEAAGIFKITSSSSSSSSKAAYGSSSDRIATHQSQMKLVHKLFGLPQWCELVASTVTEALRCAHQSLYVPDVHATSSIPIDDQFNLLLYGAASVCIFRLLPFEVAGAPVLVDGCGKGTIIYNSLTADKLRVVLDSSLHDFHCRQNVELVDRDKMRVAPESLVVDLSQLSQPVLAQMMQLIKQCCQALLTIDMKGDSFNIKAMTPFVKHVLRLSQSLLSALHVVLCKQTEVVLEFLHEADMIGELVSIAKLATYTSHISTFDNAMLRWMFMQSRWLDGMCSDDSTGDERSVTVAKDTTLESSNICELAVLEAPVEQESPYDDAEALDISSFARSKRLIEYQPVCEELGISPDICLAIAEYHGLDKEKTIAFFRETKESIKELDMTAYQSATSQSGTQNFIDDMNALSNVEYASLNSAREQSRGSSFFRRLVAADSSSLLRGDYVVAESTSEGLDSLSHGCVYNYISSTVDSIQVAAYLHETSSVISKLIKGSTSRRVIFYDTEIAEYGQSLLLSDWAAFVLSVRNTVLKLVVCGDVDLDKRVSNPQDALPLMKLLLVSAGDNSASTLRTVCKSFSTQGVTESDSGHIVTSLVLDAAKGLKDITGLSLMRETEQNVDEQLRPVLIRSTHPYTTPCKTSGKIAIPPRTTGLQIKFHPLCSTASDGAKLSFYMSKESYASRKPDHVYCGSDWATKYKPLGITSNKDLYFEFEALQNSDWPVLGMEHAGNFIKRDQDMISMAPCVNSGSVGLGDEDTLFNLFNDTVEPETASNIQKALVWPAGEPIRQGAWFFQVKIAKALSEEIFGELQIGILEDIPSASEEQITTDLVQKPGWVATSSGQIYICGAEQGSALRQWQDNDVLIIAIVVAESSYSIAFSMGEESSPIFSSSFDASKGLKPVFYLEGQAYSFEFNVGDGKPFFQDLPVHLLSLFGTQALNPLVGGLKAESSDARLQSNSSLAWGYEFVVEPLFQLAMELTRSFDLVWSYTNEDIKTGDASRKAWVWRAKSHGEYFPFGDILATSPHPPPRGILVHKSQCAAPSGFNLVFSSPKTNLLVWRPIAPEGYVALGDLVCSGSHPSPAPSVSTVVCLPLWALKECDLRECIMTFKRVGEGKNLTTASLWTIDHNFGLFFGSPYESRSSLAKRSPEFKCNGVGKSFTLATDVDSLVFAEWFKEEHVLRSPSLSWIVQLIGTLLEYSEWQPVVLTKDIFNTLVGYLKSSMAVFPHKVVSLLIQMVRLSGKQGVDLGLGDLRSLCKAILTEASTIMQKKSEIPKVLMSLIDLVIEIQTVNVVESSMKDCVTVSRSIEKEKNRLFLRNESKEERSDLVDSKEESSESVEAKCTKKWWERDSVSPQDMKVFRVIKYDNLDSIFFKESALLKLKQVLKFLHAINIPTNPDQPLDSFPVKLDRSFPKLMTSKLWFEKVSLSTMVESQHPYRDRRYHRVVHFPGAEKLTVTFDSRCSFCNGDKLLIKGGTAEVTLTALSLAQLEKDVTFPSDTLDVKLLSEEGTSSDISMHHEFGWAFLVRATGPIYETAESEVNLDELFAELRDHPVAEKKLTDISSDATVDKDLDTSDTKLLPLRREETAGTADTDAMDSSSEISAAEGAAEAPDISLFEMDSSLRPKSKRGKREKAAEANQEKSGEERKPLNVGDGALDEDVALLYKSGRSVRKGKLAVPYSSELDVKVSRGDLGSSADDYEMVLRMESTKGTDTMVVHHRVIGGKTYSVTMIGDNIFYELFVLEKSTFDRLNKKDLPEPPEKKKETTGEGATVDAEPALPPQPPVATEDVCSWQCSVCTLINSDEDSQCMVCFTPRDADTPAEDASAGVGWWCPHCTFINALRTTVCGCCGRTAVEGTSDETSHPPIPTPEEEATTPSESLTPVSNSKKVKVVETTNTVNEKGNVLRIAVKGKLTSVAKFETRLEASLLSKGSIMTPLQTHHRVSSWHRVWDNALLEYLNNKVHRKSGENLSLSDPFPVSKQYLSFQGHSLAHLTLLDIMMRVQLIASFNKAMESLLPLIDLSNDDPSSLGAVIRKSNGYLLSQVKMPALEKAIAASAATSGADIPASVTLDNFKALHSKDKGEKEPSTCQNTFVQCFRQLHPKDPSLFRYIISADRVFQINFQNESGVDAGGVFREGVSRIVEDLFSDHFNLLLLCPNGQQAVHSGMDKYVPNPKHSGPLALEMFEFVGRLMGMSIRAKLCLPFDFPPLIWKKILGETVSTLDLGEVDMIAMQQLDSMEKCDEDTVDPVLGEEAFQERFPNLKFTYMGSDQIERELEVGGSNKLVTFTNRLEYCKAVRTARLSEFDQQCSAIAKGLGQVVPSRALLLFSAPQLEELVCGSPQIDLALWKSHTESGGVSAVTVQLFWKVMESLTPKEQSGFIRFAWGRSRLPTRAEDFSVHMKLTAGGRAALPVSHTCFFSIEMPDYKTEEEMRHGLLTVIHFGVGGILNG